MSGRTDDREDVADLGDGVLIDSDVYRSGFDRFRCSGNQPHAGRVQGVHAAIDVTPVVMSCDIESPREASCPTTTFVITDDHMLIRPIADARQHGFDAGLGRQPPCGRRCSCHQFAWRDQTCTWQVALRKRPGIGDMHDQTVVSTCARISGAE